MKKLILTLLLPLCLFGIVPRMQALTASDWRSLAQRTWEKYKANYIYCGSNCMNNAGLVFDPLSNYHAVSEGVGYGMLLAVFFDDQQTFNDVFRAADRILFDETTGLHNWRVDNRGNIVGRGSATDAELDIAMALILADDLVRQGKWDAVSNLSYGDEARALLDSIWTLEVVDGKFLKPGDLFQGNGQDILNLSYFAPAWFRLYDQFLGENRWVNLIDAGYQALNATEGSAMGLAPDWSTFEGEPAFEYCDRYGRSRESCRYEMFYDGIRVPWRIGMDCILFGDERACAWSQRSSDFLNDQSESFFARLYNMKGEIIVDYRDEAMLGMWLFAAIASEDSTLQSRIEWSIYNLATQNGELWSGRDPYYYNQSLVLFAIHFLAGESQLTEE